MINEDKVKTMTRMAIYESGDGEEDLKISSYYKSDYSSFKTLIAILWMTIGYVLLIGGGVFVFVDEILARMSLDFIVMFLIVVLTVYFVLLLLFVILGSYYYRGKYMAARQRVKEFNRKLTKLNDMYEKEKQ